MRFLYRHFDRWDGYRELQRFIYHALGGESDNDGSPLPEPDGLPDSESAAKMSLPPALVEQIKRMERLAEERAK